MTLATEIREQPQVLARLLDRAPAIGAMAAAIGARDIEHVVIAARGTSDHAAIYAQYLFGVLLGLPVGLTTPSVLSLYGAEPRFGRALVVGISQSGASPDIVGVVAAGRRQGAPTLAITNEPASPLAAAAEHVLDLGAGPELAVAATKTYTAELLALALLAAGLGHGGDPLAGDPDLARVPAAVAAALETEAEVAAIARELAPRDACVVVGRGYEYATAREWALKLKELAHVHADPYSAADFRHGPIALVDAGFPVLAVAPSGHAAPDVASLLARLRDDLHADIVVLSDDPGLRALGRWSVALPALPEHLQPIASIVPGQLYAMHATLALGLDPDQPRTIAKVTLTT
ncbi:MAG TPA: SIS domain-containing protein [Candidatus Limnocylindrales bacterium]|nr:SIS domain-containing protein [Candidatus Limnocylindrales bacterium]